MRIRPQLIVLISILAITQSWADATKLPPFLPDYYLPAFNVGGQQLKLSNQTISNGVEQFTYLVNDKSISLSLENIDCEKPQRDAIFSNILLYLNSTITNKSSRFKEITESEIHVQAVEGNSTRQTFIYALPNSIQIWTYSAITTQDSDIASKFILIKMCVNKQRYIEAIADGNVSMGHWSDNIQDYAMQLITSGNKKEGLSILEKNLTTSASNYEMHVELFNNSDNLVAATNSAKIVFKNAESQDLLDQAVEFLGKTIPTIDAIPVLNTNEIGLQLILIPLPPCNPWLLDEVAKSFIQITGIPTKTRRLEKEWLWGTPERISSQRKIQNILIRFKGEKIDYKNWTKNRYIAEMRGAVIDQDALSKYYVNDLIDKVKKEAGQYDVTNYLNKLSDTLAPIRSSDYRTMYVGITEANIYSGDSNYLFSLGQRGGTSRASIMSYHMMLGKTLHESYQSRKRLVERIAKELVPAALKQLQIPRSTDPNCPYSYSGGVTRLDQKTTDLSDPVKDALNKLK